mgnify:CR=1 FL=1
MYLLNLSPDARQQVPELLFTFHNVSIKSRKRPDVRIRPRPLHSTMYLLNLLGIVCITLCSLSLHSTMYLLNLSVLSMLIVLFIPLHSTMYLLNLLLRMVMVQLQLPLHSTMYLLNHNQLSREAAREQLYIPQCIY